jgi:hypothetical protein
MIKFFTEAQSIINTETDEYMKEQNKPFAEDLAKNTLHPKKIKDTVFRRGMDFDDAVLQENYNNYRLPEGEIEMVNDTPKFAPYVVLKNTLSIV